MHYIKKTLFFFALITLSLTSCKKDEVTQPTEVEEFSTTFPSSKDVTSLAPVLPHIYIDTDDGVPIDTKDYYISADITIDGKNVYNDIEEGRTGIRGRGNSTWGFPKKPYKLKLDQATEMFGLPAAKTWILLAEYLDGSMLYNSVPFTAGHMLGIPYTNHIIPVQVTINGEYQGVYAFTEHKEVATNRIDIGNDGTLLEMDVYFDEEWKFKSKNYDLPIMVQFPKDNNLNSSIVSIIQSDFEKFEDLVHAASFPNNDYHKFFDIPAFINYMIVYDLTFNREINHPKSTYLNRKKGGKYNMGIIWDFDWGYGFGYNNTHYNTNAVNIPSLAEGVGEAYGSTFFLKFFEDPRVCELYAERWNWFKNNKYDQLRNYVIDYAETIRHGYDEDQAIWGARGSSENLDIDLQKLLDWLDARVEFLDTYANDLINNIE